MIKLWNKTAQMGIMNGFKTILIPWLAVSGVGNCFCYSFVGDNISILSPSSFLLCSVFFSFLIFWLFCFYFLSLLLMLVVGKSFFILFSIWVLSSALASTNYTTRFKISTEVNIGRSSPISADYMIVWLISISLPIPRFKTLLHRDEAINFVWGCQDNWSKNN